MPRFSNRLNDPALSINGSAPKLVLGVPGEIAVCNRVRETSIRVFFVLESIAHDLVIERSVREICPGRERALRGVGGRRVSHGPLVTVDEHRPVCENIMREEDPFLPAGTAPVDGDLRLERSRVVGERGWVVARTVAVHGRDNQ